LWNQDLERFKVLQMLSTLSPAKRSRMAIWRMDSSSFMIVPPVFATGSYQEKLYLALQIDTTTAMGGPLFMSQKSTIR
jgi:hypothetical protein